MVNKKRKVEKRMEKDTIVIIVLSVVLFLTIIGLIIVFITGPTLLLQPSDTEITESFVEIIKVLEITRSSELAGGIIFYNVSSTPLVLWNATENNGSSGVFGGTNYNVTVIESTFPIEICVIADHPLEDSGQGDLPLGVIEDEKFGVSTVNSFSEPDPANAIDLSDTTGINAIDNLLGGDSAHFRFWLDVPFGASAGRYNNTLSFTVQEMGLGC